MAAIKEPPMVLNLSDIVTKKRLISKIGTLQGLQEVSIRPRKLTRSLNANGYYWSALIVPWLNWLRAEWGDSSITAEQAHIELKKAVLGVREKVREDGEVMELIPTTHDMDKETFGQYIESASRFLAEFASIVVLSPDMYFESEMPTGRRKAS